MIVEKSKCHGPIPAGNRFGEPVSIRDGNRRLAQQLIEQQASSAFDPKEFKDDVRERIEKAIAKKVEGHEITLAEEPAQGAQIIDLMEALRASLGAKDKGKAPAKADEESGKSRKPPQRVERPQAAPRRSAKR